MWLLQGLAPEVATYNLMLATCTKLGQPKGALAVYDKCAAPAITTHDFYTKPRHALC